LAVATYVPVTDRVPATVDVSWHDPTPFVSGALHEAPAPSPTVTLPGGAPPPGATAATLTATVYACPATVAADRSDVMVVVVAAGFTVCATGADVLVAKSVVAT
jgi:hypothetical protein